MLSLLLAAALTSAPAAVPASAKVDASADARCASLMTAYFNTFAKDSWSDARVLALAAATYYAGKLTSAGDSKQVLALVRTADNELAAMSADARGTLADACQSEAIDAGAAIDL